VTDLTGAAAGVNGPACN